MFAMAFVLSIVSFMVEMMIYMYVPPYRWFALKFHFSGLVISIALSWLLGFIFGAAGMIVLLAGLLSTVYSVITYSCIKLLHENGITGASVKQNWLDHKDKVVETARDFIHAVYVFFRVITWPFRFIRSCQLKYKAVRTRFARS